MFKISFYYFKVPEEIKEPEPEVKESPTEPAAAAAPPPPPLPVFQNLYLTCPDGLKIEYFLECSYGKYIKIIK